MPFNNTIILVRNMTLKEYRNSIRITIKEAADASGVPFRTYIRYEMNEQYGNSLKRKSIVEALKNKYEITEEKGILSVDDIATIVSNVLKAYSENVQYCYLFGSYAKGNAKESSDVDLCISTSLKGLKFVGLIEDFRVALHKKVDLIRISDLSNNIELINEIMKDGIKIYKNG